MRWRETRRRKSDRSEMQRSAHSNVGVTVHSASMERRRMMKVPLTGATGRDKYIVCKALAYAILVIESLPNEQKELNDARDMKTLLDHFNDGQRVLVQHHMDQARQ